MQKTEIESTPNLLVYGSTLFYVVTSKDFCLQIMLNQLDKSKNEYITNEGLTTASRKSLDNAMKKGNILIL